MVCPSITVEARFGVARQPELPCDAPIEQDLFDCSSPLSRWYGDMPSFTLSTFDGQASWHRLESVITPPASMASVPHVISQLPGMSVVVVAMPVVPICARPSNSCGASAMDSVETVTGEAISESGDSQSTVASVHELYESKSAARRRRRQKAATYAAALREQQQAEARAQHIL